MSETMHYFKAVKGRACPRYGTDTFIGCRRGPKGFVWNEDAVVAIPENELRVHRKAYRGHLRHGDLLASNKAEYDESVAARTRASEKRRAERDAARKKAQEVFEASAEVEAPAADEGDTAIDDESPAADVTRRKKSSRRNR